MEEKRNRVNGNICTEQDKNNESLGFEPSYRRTRIQTVMLKEDGEEHKYS
jgi:hypothetical protein